MENIVPSMDVIGWKFLAVEIFTLSDSRGRQRWFGIRVLFFRVWVAWYRW